MRQKKSVAKFPPILLLFTAILLPLLDATANANETTNLKADVVIAGGSTAALAAAIASAESGASTILIEPTDWIGGQLTASGVPPVDEAWHKITDPATGKVTLDVATIARDPRNMTPLFRDMLAEIGNPGRGWVSRYCYLPKTILNDHLEPQVSRLSNRLTVLRESVVKRVVLLPRRIGWIDVIQRTPKKSPGEVSSLGSIGYDRLPSQDLGDWYDPAPSDRFNKRTIQISCASPHSVFIDATEWGEVLALATNNYLQGVEVKDGASDGAINKPGGNDVCGQSIVFGFAQRMHKEPTPESRLSLRESSATEKNNTPPKTDSATLGFGKYKDREDAWEKIWTYRRLASKEQAPSPGDITLQNWGYEPAAKNGGNDYPFGYLLLSKKKTATSRIDWRGGVDLAVMAAAESRAFAWHKWFKSQAPKEIGANRITLARDVFGTEHGLCKLPYIRDTRRSIGLDGFVLRLDDLIGEPSARTGKKFVDRIAIGAYPADVHFLNCCEYPEHVKEHRDTKPFYIPFRALTHREFDNLLVAGKTMAQSFMANSATRLQPIEWSSGTAAGVAAAMMSREGMSSREAFESVEKLQKLVAEKTPVDWSL